MAQFFLFLSHDKVIIPLLILGYIWFDQKIFFHAIRLILINMLINYSLKVTFQIPLEYYDGKEKGFAFPSGHMQSSVVLYGWLMMKIQDFWYKALTIILLCGVGWGLVHCGYHKYFDVLGGICVGFLVIFLYTILAGKKKIISPVLLFCSTCLMLYIAYIYKIPEHVWMAYYALIGTILSEYIFYDEALVLTTKNKIFATAFCFVSILLVKTLFKFMHLPLFLFQMQWIIIGFSIPGSTHIFALLQNYTSNRS